MTDMIPPLRAATIGSGKISEEHLKFLRAGDPAQLVGVCDLSPALAAWSARQFGAAAAYTDHRVMLEEAKPQVVHVLTPPHTHEAIITDCLAAGAHVITEKPVAPTHAQFTALWQAAQRAGVLLIEDHNYRFNAPVRELGAIIDRGELGEIVEVEVRMSLNVRGEGNRYADRNLPHPSHRLPCGVIHEFITHLCYLSLHLLPTSEDIRVDKAAWRNVGRRGEDDPFMYDDLDAMVSVGAGRARIRFTSQTQPDGFYVTARGTKGFAEADLFVPYLRPVVYPTGFGPLASMVSLRRVAKRLKRDARRAFWSKVLQEGSYDGLRHFLAGTYHAIATGAPPPVTFDDMDRTSRLIDALAAQAEGARA